MGIFYESIFVNMHNISHIRVNDRSNYICKQFSNCNCEKNKNVQSLPLHQYSVKESQYVQIDTGEELKV